jgi:phosphoribosyl 1,2-cyclic phosphodiesterase
MRVTLWGTRGSLPSPGPDTVHYGGNTSCAEVRGSNGALVLLDSGTEIVPLGATVEPARTRLDLLLTHLHADHIQGLGFFRPLYRSDLEFHILGGHPRRPTICARAYPTTSRLPSFRLRCAIYRALSHSTTSPVEPSTSGASRSRLTS